MVRCSLSVPAVLFADVTQDLHSRLVYLVSHTIKGMVNENMSGESITNTQPLKPQIMGKTSFELEI
jgi:hypothetical protein